VQEVIWMQFGDTLRWLIEENDLTQKQLSEDLNVAASTIGNYVIGQREPDFDMLKRIADYFHVSTDYLLDYHPAEGANQMDEALLRAFRSLPPEQQRICLEQMKVAAKVLGREE
jgi:transcriptional regulator with XRE-family HTH domain